MLYIENFLLSIILMSFILWLGRLLAESRLRSVEADFAESNTPVTNISRFKLFVKKVVLVAGAFILCFSFVFIVNKYSQVSILIRYLQEDKLYKLNQSNTQDLSALQESVSKKVSQGFFEVLLPRQVKTVFTDIAGLYEAKEELRDIVNFLDDPIKFQRLGAKPPKGILMYGSPGTGKTMLARALAGEAGVSFISTSGSQFEEEYVGVGAARIRELFQLARKQAPCVVFIDEVDSIAAKRHGPNSPAWSAQAVNQLLTEMDGLNDSINQGIIVVAASNRMDALDSAILRPGRLDRHIKLELPSQAERQDIISLYLQKITVDSNVKAEQLAKMTTGFSGADLANLVNEAAIEATRGNKKEVDLESFETAKDRFILGSTRKATIMSDQDKKITAYHEAGHTIVGYFLPNHNPLYKVTIAPRGPSLGHTNFEAPKDTYTHSKEQLESMIASSLGGRVAEELIFGSSNATTGAENDLKQATKLAYNMVTKWGYSNKIGLMYVGDHNSDLDFVSKKIIEEEVKLILKNAYEKAKNLLMTHKNKLHTLANELLDKETLSKDQVEHILGKQKI